jgi:hypothetical protein
VVLGDDEFIVPSFFEFIVEKGGDERQHSKRDEYNRSGDGIEMGDGITNPDGQFDNCDQNSV